MRRHAARLRYFASFGSFAATIAAAATLGCAGSTTGVTQTYYLHWNCGGQTQCASVFGAMTGIQVTYPNAASITPCISQMITFANNGTIQEWNGKVGDWCDNVSSTTELGPAPGF